MKTTIDVSENDIEMLITVLEGAMGDDAGRFPIYQNLKFAAAQLETKREKIAAGKLEAKRNKNAARTVRVKPLTGQKQYRCTGCGHECVDPVADMEWLNSAKCVSCCGNRNMVPIKRSAA